MKVRESVASAMATVQVEAKRAGNTLESMAKKLMDKGLNIQVNKLWPFNFDIKVNK